MTRHSCKSDRLSISRVNDAYDVGDVSVAVSRRVPAEIDRHRITRLNVVGEGHFGVVTRATLTPIHRNVLPITVAVKTHKDNSNTRELLKEAAFIALLEHRNLVAVVGVVSRLLLLCQCCHPFYSSCSRNVGVHMPFVLRFRFL